MARIELYNNDSNVTSDDKVIGTDALDNSTKNFTVGDMIALVPPYTAGTNISIANNVISCTLVDTDTIDYISNVSLVGSELRFAGIGNGFTGNVDIGGLIQPDTSYLGNVALNGNILEFTGLGAAFTGAIDLTQFSSNATYTAGTGISIVNNVISSTVTDTDTNDFVSNVVLNGNILEFTGTGGAFAGTVDLAQFLDNTDTNDIDYVEQVILNGNILDFVGMGNAFTGGVDLSQFKNIYTAGTGIDITNNVISVGAVGAYSYLDNVTLSGTDLIFAGIGDAFGGTIDLSGLSGGGAAYTAGTNIDITNNEISCTVTDTNTTYAYGAVGAGSDILFALSGIDGTNNVVTMTAGQNITLTDNGSNTFTIDADKGVDNNTEYGITLSSYLSGASLNLPGTDGSQDFVRILPGSGIGMSLAAGELTISSTASASPETLILKLSDGAIPITSAPGTELSFEPIGQLVKTNSLHINPVELSLASAIEIGVANDCTAKVSLGAYIDNGGQHGQITFEIYEYPLVSSPVLAGSASFDMPNQAVSAIPTTFLSFFDFKAGATYKFTAYSTQHLMTILPGSFIQIEILK